MKQNNVDPVIEIQTPRLILRPPKISDMSSIKESIDASMNDIAPWLEWATSTFTINSLEYFLNYAIDCNKEIKPRNLFFSIFDQTTHQFIGDVYYGLIDWSVPYCAIGYWLDSRQTGKGYMTEAVNALTKLGLSYFHMHRIEISMSSLNLSSKKIPERLGFEFEAELKNRHINFITKEVSSTLFYSCFDINKLPNDKINWVTKNSNLKSR